MRSTCEALLLLTAFLIYPAIACAVKPPPNYEQWDTLLNNHVHEVRDGKATEVDYVSISAGSERLNSSLETMSLVELVDFESWSKNEQLAFLINIYNAFTIKLILDADEKIDSIKDLGGFFSSPWKKKFIPLFGSTVSLDYIEHELIRESGRYNEPRIHFAVNCASIGCPSLRNEAYVAEKLEQQLEDQTERFLSDETRNLYSNGVLTVSSIFKWYIKDFEKGWRGAKSLSQFLALYSRFMSLNEEQSKELKTDNVTIKFGKYDWRLNSTQ